MTIQRITQFDPSLLGQFNHLLHQLSVDSTLLDEKGLKNIVENDTTMLFVVKQDGKLNAMLTLVISKAPSGVKTWIEDVVVDSQFRGQGLAKKMINEAIFQAKLVGAKSVNLTSRPSRLGANKLYQKMGFEQRQTNVYKFDIS
ncbi:MAG: GNAT family N-acetyltransferase [Reichenbachiella sp.]